MCSKLLVMVDDGALFNLIRDHCQVPDHLLLCMRVSVGMKKESTVSQIYQAI